MRKGYLDLKAAYEIAIECNPSDEVVAFCCDLGNCWLFKFVPKDNEDAITGHYGFVVEKSSGKVAQYDMLANMSKIEGKTNLVHLLPN